ncbi:amidase [Candidatus Pacearchaeota archaeon]|nr:amidase [Candidatus Pacearchaeota archaeon]
MNVRFLIGVLVVVVLLGVGLYWSGLEDISEPIVSPVQQETVSPSRPSENISSPTVSPSIPPSPSIRTHRVALRDFAFVPASLTIAPGDTVVWTNEDRASHTVTSDQGKELASSLFGKGETYEHTFSTPGTYAYHCGPHGSMKGVVVVA